MERTLKLALLYEERAERALDLDAERERGGMTQILNPSSRF